MLAVPTKADLAQFTGRPANTFTGFADQALAQATLMFKVVTGIEDYPDDPDLKQVALNAIMEMADRLLLEQPYAEVSTRPFQSETIGSYTYSRATATSVAVQNGSKTGLFWWDVAVDLLTVAGMSVTGSGSIKVDLPEVRILDDGNRHLLDPGNDVDRPPYVRIS